MLDVDTTCTHAGQSVPADLARERARNVLAEWCGRDGIVVFGAGAHTHKILPVLHAHADKIVGIADDSPRSWGMVLGPWMVAAPARLIDDHVGGILISSDVQQRSLAARARQEYGDRCAILTLYSESSDDAAELPFTGERQTAANLEEIELGHRARYYWALQHLPAGARVLDAACGNGYGSYILAGGGQRVLGVDISSEAIAFARHHYAHPEATFAVAAIDVDGALARCTAGAAPFDAVISMETIEHLDNPQTFLRAANELLRPGGVLLCSTPNADAMQVSEAPFHRQHFTHREMCNLLTAAGFDLSSWYGQEGLEVLRNRCSTAQRYQLYNAIKSA